MIYNNFAKIGGSGVVVEFHPDGLANNEATQSNFNS